MAATVSRTSRRTSSTFSAELSIKESEKFGMGVVEWADYQPTDVSIIMATSPGGGDQSTMIVGEIDVPRIHWSKNTVSVSGRDKGSSLSYKRRSEKFNNKKSSEIVEQIAKDHGLNPVLTASNDFAGKIYDQDTVHLVLNRSDFEILSDLAEREGYRWYVNLGDLIFEPKGQQKDVFSVFWAPPGTVAPYGVATVTDLETHRNMEAAKTTISRGAGWHHKDKTLYKSEQKVAGVGKESVEHEHHHNGRRQADLDKIAKSRLKDAIRHDCNVVTQGPGDLTIDPRMQLQLSGTGTIYDMLYDIDSVEWSISWGGAFEMSVAAMAPKTGRSVDE